MERDPRVDRAVSVERGRRSRGDVASIVFLRAKTFAQIGASRAPRREYSRAFVDAETRVWGWMRSIEADPRAIARRSPRDSPERVPPAAASVCCQIDEKQKFDRARRSPHAPPTVEGAEKGAAVGFLSSDGAIREVRESPRRFAARAPRQCRAARNPRGCSGSSPPISRTPATRCQVTLVSGRCLAFFGKFHDCLHVKTRGPTVSLSFFFSGGIWPGFFWGLPFRSVGRALALNRRVASRSPIALRAAAGANDAGSSPPSPVEDRTAARTGARE